MKRKFLKYFFLFSINLALIGAPTTVPNTAVNPAAIIMNQQEQQLKQIEAQRKILEEMSQNREGIKSQESKSLDENKGKGIKFKLKKIQFSKKSEVLSEEELQEIVSKYENRDITVGDLYSIVNQINDLYHKKGYIVCKAGLPPQTISKGVVKIVLVEGKTGNVIIKGNTSTRESYIKKRINLRENNISNLDELNESLIWFNGTNDVQIRIQLKAGEEVGTTDYILTVYEPKRHQYSLFSDNSGSESSGKYRGGISYTNNSLFGFRDQLSITGLKSEGSDSGSIMYTVPVNKFGTKLQLSYSKNTMEIVNGDLSEIDITGDSSSYGIAITHPFVITPRNKVEGRIEWNKQKSSTDFMDMPWVDDTIQHYLAGLTITTNFSNGVAYQNHTFTRGKWEDISGEIDYYSKYNFIGIYQLSLLKNNIFSIRANAQRAYDDYLPSADQFYVGGSYSVRGFAESYLGGDNGASINIEYEVPIINGISSFVFLDGGFVTGENSFDDNDIASAGFGLKLSPIKGFYSQVTAGFPFKHEYNEQEVDKVRIHYSVSYIL